MNRRRPSIPSVRRWLPAPHWASVRGRALADAGSLALAAAIVVVVSLLVGAVPPLLRDTADDAVQDAVRAADTDADVLVHAPWERDDGVVGRIRAPGLAEELDELRDRAIRDLGPDPRSALYPPIATASSPSLKVTGASTPLTFQLTYLSNGTDAGGGPHLTWLAGGPPQASVPVERSRVEVPYDGRPWPVQVGLSEANAEALKLRPGDRVPLKDAQENVKDVQVSGIFRATDTADRAWRLAPWLLSPDAGADGVGTHRLGGLLSPDSLPDARLAFNQNDLPRTVWFGPDPGVLTWDSARAIVTTVITLKATSGSSSGLDTAPKWQTQLDVVLRDVRSQIAAASAQASVLLTGVLAVAVLVLLLAADLLVRRRAPALTAARQRGASLPDLGVELLLESAAVALVAGAVGLVLATAIAPGVAWSWALPVAVAAALASPAFGTLAAARATRDQRVPANRSARRWTQRTRQARRATLEAAVLIGAVAAFVALYQRGILPAAGELLGMATRDGAAAVAGDVTGPPGPAVGPTLPATAPTLGVLAGALVLSRLLPAGAGLALRRALRSRRPLAVFGAARVAATSSRALPLVAMVAAAALASFALTLAATIDRGLVDGAWRTVGADVRVDVAPASTPGLATQLAGRIAAAAGVEVVVTAQVTDGVRVGAGSGVVTPRLVVVDASALQRLLLTTPLPQAQAQALGRLGTTGPGDIPVLARSSDGGLHDGMRLELLRDGAPAVGLTVVGTAPAVGDAADVVLVDAAAAASAGLSPVPNTVWVTGPGAVPAAANAVAPHPPTVGSSTVESSTVGPSGVGLPAPGAVTARTVSRADVLRERRGAPLTAGLLRLTRISAVTLVGLGLLGLALGAAAGAPQRWQTLTRLRTLGLRTRDTRRIAAGELLPSVVVAAVGGLLVGVLLARLAFGPLALRLLTGQSDDPRVAVPWWGLAPVLFAFLAAVAVVVPVETALRRRRRLSEVLRAGDG